MSVCTQTKKINKSARFIPDIVIPLSRIQARPVRPRLTISSSDNRSNKGCSLKCFTIQSCTSFTSVMVYTKPCKERYKWRPARNVHQRTWMNGFTHVDKKIFKLIFNNHDFGFWNFQRNNSSSSRGGSWVLTTDIHKRYQTLRHLDFWHGAQFWGLRVFPRNQNRGSSGA